MISSAHYDLLIKNYSILIVTVCDCHTEYQVLACCNIIVTFVL